MREKINYSCGVCNSSKILYDDGKGELFCSNCGLVFREKYNIFIISEYEKKVKRIEAEQRKLLMSEC